MQVPPFDMRITHALLPSFQYRSVAQSHLLAASVVGQLQPEAVDGHVNERSGLHNCWAVQDSSYVLYVTILY